MKKTVLAALVITTSALSAGARADDLYLYQIELKNAPLTTNNTEWESDAPTFAILRALKEQSNESCIDIRSLGSTTSGHLMRSGTVGLLSQSELGSSTKQLIKKYVCEGALTQCSVSISEESFSFEELSLASYPFTSSQYSGAPSLRSLQGKLPRFSSACETGNYSDSWNDAASTPEARAYLEKIGIDLSQSRTLSLNTVDGRHLYTFGFPKH